MYAEKDFSAAKILLESHRPPYEIIAYHCQQAAEKYLKAPDINAYTERVFGSFRRGVFSFLTSHREAEHLKGCPALSTFRENLYLTFAVGAFVVDILQNF